MLKLDAKSKRFLLWATLVFVVIVIVMIVVYFVKKDDNKETPGDTLAGAPTGPLTGPVVVLPPTSTPPIVPANPAPPATNPGQSTPLPGTTLEVIWTYISDLTWKMNDVVTKGDATNPGLAAYRCEITNRIIEMGERDLSAFSQLYRKWYNRSLRDDYCAKVKSSGCWTTLWDSKPAAACKRLKPYA